MSKILFARGMTVDDKGVSLGGVGIRIDTHTIEFCTADYSLTANIETIKRLIKGYNKIGSTVVKDDKANRTRIRYTYGMHGNSLSKQVTMSLSRIDRTGDEEFMITADAVELDKHLRGVLE